MAGEMGWGLIEVPSITGPKEGVGMSVNELLKDYPVTVEVPVVWGEMDAFSHVNNVVYFRYFETARIAYFDEIDFMKVMKDTGVGPILASTQCRFRIPLSYPDRVSIGVRARNLGDDRFTHEYVVVSHKLEKIAAEGDGLIVTYNYQSHEKATVPTVIQNNIQELEQNRA